MAKKSMIAKAKRTPKFGVRGYHRCVVCGRPRAFMRRFNLCRICFRERALDGRAAGRHQVELVGPMNISDPIADMLTRVRNASRARHTEVVVPASRTKREIARILKAEGFIADVHRGAGRAPATCSGSRCATSTARCPSCPASSA